MGTFDPSGLGGFTTTWVVTSAENPSANGINLTIQANDGFFNSGSGRPNLLFRFDDNNDNTFHLMANDGSSTVDLITDAITLSEVLDGFTLTAELTPDGWSYWATGLDSLDPASGAWTATHNYDTLFDATTHVGAFIQKGGGSSGGSQRTLEIDRITVTTVPEPATLALLGLAACGLGGYLRRRRQAATV